MTSPPRLLIADDQRDILEALLLLLKNEGYRVDTAASPAAVLASIEESDYDAVLIDLNYARDTTSGQEGLELLARLQSSDPTLPVIVMTAWASVDVAVEAMRRGGAVVLDTRSPEAFGGGHIPGVLNVDLQGGQFGTRAAWLLPPDKPVILVLEGPGVLKKWRQRQR